MPSIKQLQKQLEALTGRPSVSTDEAYLTRRIRDLEAAKAAGEDVRSVSDVDFTPMSVSVPVPAKEAAKRIAKKHDKTASALVLEALKEWAENHGHESEAHHFEVS